MVPPIHLSVCGVWMDGCNGSRCHHTNFQDRIEYRSGRFSGTTSIVTMSTSAPQSAKYRQPVQYEHTNDLYSTTYVHYTLQYESSVSFVLTFAHE